MPLEFQGEWQGRAGGPRNLLHAQAQLLRSCRGSGRQREGRCPIYPTGSLKGERRALFTQPVADTVLTYSQQGGWAEDPNCFLGRRGHCLVPQRHVVGRWGTVPLGKLILMANMEPSWQGESEEGGQPHHQQKWEVELEGREGEGGWGGGQAGPFLWLE